MNHHLVALFSAFSENIFCPIICINMLITAAIVKKALLHLFQCYTVTKMRPFRNPLSFCALYAKIQIFYSIQIVTKGCTDFVLDSKDVQMWLIG